MVAKQRWRYHPYQARKRWLIQYNLKCKPKLQARTIALCAAVYYGLRIDRFGFDIRRVAFPSDVVSSVGSLAAALDQNMSLYMISAPSSRNEGKCDLP